MSQVENELIILKVEQSLVDLCMILANARIKFEYNRMGLPLQDRIIKIADGYLGEFLVSSFLTVNKIPFLHYINIGDYDKGFDFVIGGNYFDVKTTIFKLSTLSVNNFINFVYRKYHLYVADDPGQFQGSKANYYIQVIVSDDKKNAILCGYSKKENLKPSFNENNIFPAMQVPINDLSAMVNLTNDEELIPFCSNCGVVISGQEQSIENQIAQSLLKQKRLLCQSCFKSA